MYNVVDGVLIFYCNSRRGNYFKYHISRYMILCKIEKSNYTCKIETKNKSLWQHNPAVPAQLHIQILFGLTLCGPPTFGLLLEVGEFLVLLFQLRLVLLQLVAPVSHRHFLEVVEDAVPLLHQVIMQQILQFVLFTLQLQKHITFFLQKLDLPKMKSDYCWCQELHHRCCRNKP